MNSLAMIDHDSDAFRRPYEVGQATYEVVVQTPSDRNSWYIQSIHKDRDSATEVAQDLLKVINLKVRIIRSVFDGDRFWDKVLLDTKSADDAVWSRVKTTPMTKAVLRELFTLRGQKENLKSFSASMLAQRGDAFKALADARKKQRIELVVIAATFTLVGAITMAAFVWIMK